MVRRRVPNAVTDSGYGGDVMAKYRKKPVVIDAVQWFPGIHVDGVIWPAPSHMRLESSKGYVMTLEGGHIVSSGDWIITGVMGEKYHVKPDIFKQTYEKVE